MKRHIRRFGAAAAVLSIAVTAAQADPAREQQGRHENRGGPSQGQRPPQGQKPAQGQRPAQGPRPPALGPQAQRQTRPAQAAPQAAPVGSTGLGPGRGARSGRTDLGRPPPPQVSAGRDHPFPQPPLPARPSRPFGVSGAQSRPGPPPLTGWSHANEPGDREAAGRDWRASHAGWDQRAVWRGRPNWWRSSPAFQGYYGARDGYFWVPEIGYVSAPSPYLRHYWPPGDMLPSWYWQYRILDYERYGLPTPPDGCFWVWMDDDVALIEQGGFIVDVVRNVW